MIIHVLIQCNEIEATDVRGTECHVYVKVIHHRENAAAGSR